MSEVAEFFFGSEIKPYIELEPVSSLNMDDYDFKAEFYCYSGRKVVVKKDEMTREHENKYVACVDTRDLGSGILKCLFTRQIPDPDCPDGLRTDVKEFVFDAKIVGVQAMEHYNCGCLNGSVGIADTRICGKVGHLDTSIKGSVGIICTINTDVYLRVTPQTLWFFKENEILDVDVISNIKWIVK